MVFNIAPDHAFIKVDTFVIPINQKTKPFSLTLPEGKHNLKVWAPGMVLQEEDIMVVKDSITFVSKGLKELTPEYEAYKLKLEEYESKQFTKVGKSLLIVGADILVTSASFAFFLIFQIP